MESEEIRVRLSQALALRNMKQIELSEKTKIPKGSISQYVSGYVEPKTDRIYLMAKALCVDPVWLMGMDVPMEPRPLAERYSTESAEMLVKIKNNPTLMQLCKEFMLLDSAQQQSVVNLVHSMIPHKQP